MEYKSLGRGERGEREKGREKRREGREERGNGRGERGERKGERREGREESVKGRGREGEGVIYTHLKRMECKSLFQQVNSPTT